MGVRGKVVLARIENKSKRKVSMNKRKGGLVKKVTELTTLCDAEAAVVIYSPGDAQPTVWPSTSAATETISKFLRRPETERKANAHTAFSFMQKKCKKLKEKAERLIKKNEERSILVLMEQINQGKIRAQDLDLEKKQQMLTFAQKKKEQVLLHIRRLKEKEQQDPHLSQVTPHPAVEMPPASGLNTINFGSGTNLQSPVAAHGQQVNLRGMTPPAASQSPVASYGQLTNASRMTGLAPAFAVPEPNLLTSADYTTSFRVGIGRLYAQRNFGGMRQQALHPPKALSSGMHMRPLSQLASNGLYMNGLGLAQPHAVASFQNMNFTRPNSLPLWLDNSAANRVDMTGRLYGQTNPAGMMQQYPLSSSLSMPADITAYSARSGPPLSLPLDLSPHNSSSSTINMAGRLHEENNFSDMMHSPPLALPSTISGLDMIDNGLINAGTRTFTVNGNFGGMIQHQHAPPSYFPPQSPWQLGQPPMPPVQTTGSNISGAEYIRGTIGLTTPSTSSTELDLSDYGFDADGYSGPPINPLDYGWDGDWGDL